MNRKKVKKSSKKVHKKEAEFLDSDDFEPVMDDAEYDEPEDFDEEETLDYERFEAQRIKRREPRRKKIEESAKEREVKTSNKVIKQQRTPPVHKKPQNQRRKRTTGRFAKMTILDRVIASTGAMLTVLAVVTCTMYVSAKTADREAASFQELGSQLEGIHVIGESGLLAVADVQSVQMEAMLDMQEPAEAQEYEEKELETKKVEVEMHLSSMKKDLKIKFINKETKKLIPNARFEVNITDSKKKSYTLVDEDMDGVIYLAEITAGTCSVELSPMTEQDQYVLPEHADEVSIKDKIEYKKVDVADEVKKESEINASKEDTKKQETVVESVLTDTVPWVESTKTPVDGSGNGEGYEEVSKDKITDPATFASSGGFMKLGEVISTPADPNAAQPPADPNTEQPPVAEQITVVLNQTGISMKPGETAILTAVTTPAGGAVSFASSDPTVASIGADGTVAAYKAGTVTMTAATATGQTAACTVTVAEAEAQKPSISIDQTAVTLMTEKTVKLNAQVSNAADGSVIWTIDNGAVASVAGDGTVTGSSAGTATVTAASAQDPSVTVSCGITVKANPEKDTANKLKDNEGNPLYVKQSDGAYREAVYADYYTAEKFYKQAKQEAVNFKYTGWQTIDGKTYYFDANGTKVTGEQIIQGAKYNFGSEGALSSGSGNMGIDVSKWNGSIDWNAVKNAGVSYVIIRCGYRGSSTGALIEDPTFRTNIKGASAAGLKVGVYFFTQAMNEGEAVEEASMVLQMISGYQISYPVYLDVEPSGGRGDGISKEARTAVCQAFCQTIQNSGYKAGIYANKTWLTTHINTGSLTGYKIWLAQYAAAPTYSATKYDMWQYSSTGKVAGIKGNVDLNISYLGY